ncbi:MAG: hypothetical protein AB7F19_04210 [Candidatus Babeliales bacterium]
MIFKITHRYIFIFSFSFTAYAMDAPKNFVSDTVAISLPNLPLGKMIKVQVQIDAPQEAITDAAKKAHFLSRAPELKGKLQKVLVTYLNNLTPQNFELMKIIPSAFYYEPDTGKFILREEYGTHQISDTVQAFFETRVACSHDPKQNTLTTNPFSLYVFPTTGCRKPYVISVDRLRCIFPDQNQLQVNDSTRSQLIQQSYVNAAQKAHDQLATGRLAERIDPEADYRKVYTQDLVTLFKYYLTTQDIGDID